MAKRPRAKPRPSATRPARGRATPRTAKTPRPRPAPSGSRAPAAGRAYENAIALYEQAVGLLQRRDYERAAVRLREVLEQYPDERELTDRARVYLRVCEREMMPKAKAPSTLEERVYAATIALNAGEVGRALALLTDASAEAPNDVRIRYMMGAVQARRGARTEALAELRRATELDPESGGLARHDADFEGLHADEEFLRVTAPPAASRRRRQRARASR